MVGVRWLSIILVVVLLLTGLSGPVAWAQQSPQLEYYSPPVQIEESGGPAYGVGAGVATFVTIPMRAATCVLGGIVGFTILVMTFGSGYRAAMAAAEEGCQSPWIITDDEMRAPSVDEASGETARGLSREYQY